MGKPDYWCSETSVMLISRGSKCCLIQRKEPCPTFGRMLTTTLSEMNVVVRQLLFGRQVMSNSVIPWTVSRQAPLSMGFPRQKYLSGLPFPPPRDLPNPGIEPMSPALVGEFFTTEPPRKPWYVNYTSVKKQKTTLSHSSLEAACTHSPTYLSRKKQRRKHGEEKF